MLFRSHSRVATSHKRRTQAAFPPSMFAGGADGNGHLPRPRRPRRVGGMGPPPPDQAASAPPPHPAPPPCTDYDMAYFKAYSHIGVHEEMLKVTPALPTLSFLSLWILPRVIMSEGWAPPLRLLHRWTVGLGFCFLRASIWGPCSPDRKSVV